MDLRNEAAPAVQAELRPLTLSERRSLLSAAVLETYCRLGAPDESDQAEFDFEVDATFRAYLVARRPASPLQRPPVARDHRRARLLSRAPAGLSTEALAAWLAAAEAAVT